MEHRGSTDERCATREAVEAAVRGMGCGTGIEDSVKLIRGGPLLASRRLWGLRIRALPFAAVRAFCLRVGMPGAGLALIEQHFPAADTLLVAVEPRPDGCTIKVYLEFWEQVRRGVAAAGSAAPRLLNLGVKWDQAAPDQHVVARYTCWPLLSGGDIAARVALLLGPECGVGAGRAAQVVRLAEQNAPGAPLIYLELEEEGNSRRSYDINLYRGGLRMGALRSMVDSVCNDWCQAPGLPWAASTMRPERRVGHISGGVDRDGREFMTFYYEIEPIP